MNGCIDGWTKEQMKNELIRRINERFDKTMNAWVDRWKKGIINAI